eukprot:TRINITY_DN66693_c0_g1_i1.p1 TRINITY_DN66693_c0_g1~~TRINITY_DN66693_c0_g1_i1.p1  ORF type:complete len:469 (+),score=27.97 TRINITY_DN66693_c0_g1_i1:67-1473(+)
MLSERAWSRRLCKLAALTAGLLGILSSLAWNSSQGLGSRASGAAWACLPSGRQRAACRALTGQRRGVSKLPKAQSSLRAGALGIAPTAQFYSALGTSSRSMLEVATSLVVGVLAYKGGFLTPEALAAVSRITVGILIPALLVGKVALTASSMQMWGIQTWLLIVPLCALCQIGIHFLASGGLIKYVAGLDPLSPKGRTMRLAMLFPNSSMPLVFCQSLFRGHPDTTLLAEGALSFYLIGWSSTFWTAGFALLKGTPPEGGGEPEENETKEPEASAWERIQRTVRQILTPPVRGVLLGLAIGLLPPLRWLIVPHAGRTSPPPLAFAFYGIENLGRAAIPLSQLVLAGSLTRSFYSKPSDDKSYSWGPRDLLAVILMRSLLSPLLSGLALSWLLRTLGLVSLSTSAGCVLTFVLILVSSMPSAQNAILIPNMLGRPRLASAMTQLFLAVYAIVLPIASLWFTVGLSVTGL